MKNRNKILGYILMLLGISLPLYAFTSISINNIRAKKEYNNFLEYQSKIGIEEKKEIENNIRNYNDGLNVSNHIVDPFSNEDYKTDYGFNIKNKDKIIAYLRIPAIDLYKPVRLDASYENLSKGLGHLKGTALPVGKIGNRSVIAGHRGWYQDVMFLNLGELNKDDEIYIDIMGKSLKYIVTDKEVIKPYEWDKIKPIEDKDMITLLTCDPITPPSPYRLIVNAQRLEEVDAETDIIVEQKQNKIEINKKVKYINLSIYSITLLLWLAFLYYLYRFKKIF